MKYMVRISFFIFWSVFGIINTYAQTPAWEWATSIGSQSFFDTAEDIAIDKSGNIYLVGNYNSPTITFGNIVIKNNRANNDTSLYYNDIFVVKYNSQGNVLWAKSAGGRSLQVTALTVNNNGKIHITGTFGSSSPIFGVDTLYHKGYTDIFVATLDTDGNTISAKTITGKGRDVSTDIATDTKGNYIVTGYFDSYEIMFDNDTIINSDYPIDLSNDNDIFLVKYNLLDSVLWVTSARGIDDDYSNSISTDMNGNIYITGSFSAPTIEFGAIKVENVNNDENLHLTSDDIFVTKYNENGSEIWAKGAGGSLHDRSNSIIIDSSGNLFITGYFSSIINFEGTILEAAYSAQSNDEIFVAKYDTSGTFHWAKGHGDFKPDRGINASMDRKGNVYITGIYQSPFIQFGADTIHNTTSWGSADIFIFKYDTKGNEIWAKSIGGILEDYRISPIVFDIDGNGYIVGTYNSESITFDTDTLKQAPHSQIAYLDIFFAKLSNSITSINKTTFHSSLSLFPNPSRSTFRISGIKGESTKIIMYSLTGEKIYESLLKDSQTIDLSGKAKGMYVYQLQKDGAVLKTGKIIIE